jgi:hypothetical protein
MNTTFSNFRRKMTKHNIPAMIANRGSTSTPYLRLEAASIPERAPVGPTMLYCEPPRIPEISPAQKAVATPALGLAPPAK